MKKADIKHSAQLEFIHLCEYSLIDVSGKLSLIGMFGNFNFSTFPTSFPKFTVVASVQIPEPGQRDYGARVVILNPDGTEFGKADFMLKNQGQGIAVLNANFVNREFRMPGMYSIEIWLQDQKIGQKSFSVTAVERKERK